MAVAELEERRSAVPAAVKQAGPSHQVRRVTRVRRSEGPSEALEGPQPQPAKTGSAKPQPAKAERHAGSAQPAGEEQPKRPRKPRKNIELGRRGEDAAARFLDRRGYEVVDRNWECFAGEADIVARDGGTLVFVEVKTRSNCDKGFPAEAVTRAKREKYERIALAYLQDHEVSDIAIRFDVVSIVVIATDRALIRHHINAFSVD